MTLSGGKTAPQPSGRGRRGQRIWADVPRTHRNQPPTQPQPGARTTSAHRGRKRPNRGECERPLDRRRCLGKPASAQPRIKRHPNSRHPGADLSSLPGPQKPENRAKAGCLKPARRDYSPPRSVTENQGKSLNFSLAQPSLQVRESTR